jgi:hypothetical protein
LLSIWDNRLVGTIPDSLFDLTNLVYGTAASAVHRLLLLLWWWWWWWWWWWL